MNEFLTRIEKTRNVQVLAATNFPWRLPTAVLRRFQYILYVPLPTLSSRVGILKRLLGGASCNLYDHELADLGRMCEKYVRRWHFLIFHTLFQLIHAPSDFCCSFSGSDINRAIQFANSLPVLLCQRSKYFETVEQNGVAKFVPCSQSDVSAEAITFNELPHDRISAPELTHVKLFVGYVFENSFCCRNYDGY